LQRQQKKDILWMDLGHLLFVAKKEKIINAEIDHLVHFLQGYRNLIHPGAEKRKSGIDVSEQNAKLAWDIVRKIILEV
jgi:hypothetical protein